jgi:uncharacterized Zn finger protein
VKPRRPYRPSRWDYAEWYPRATKKPPPGDGIKMKKAGTTWWGQRWIQSLERVLAGDSGRLSRGRTYARAGRTHDLVVKGGKVTAKVTGSRDEPYEIAIELSQLSDSAWETAILAMADKAQFSAALLGGEMPKDIDEAFLSAKVSLFPEKRKDLATSCSCPDWGDPCKHVAATHYILGEELDRDPFLLFELRGRTKAQVLDALRAARGGSAGLATSDATNAGASSTDDAVNHTPGVSLGTLVPADYDRPRGALPALHFSFGANVAHGAVLKQLGVPATWRAESSPEEALSPILRRAAEAARRIAMAESPSDIPGSSEEPVAPVPSEPPSKSRERRKTRGRPKRG